MNSLLAAAAGEAATCRICHSEGTYEEPLFHPCRCSGSIGHVHQECLVEWLSHSQKKHCELCKTPFRFTKLYDAHMPSVLPWTVFLKQALLHLTNGLFGAVRALLVITIWMVVLPWIVRWSWRWMFWFVEAGWARDIYYARIEREAMINLHENPEWSMRSVTKSLQDAVVKENTSTADMLYGMAKNFLVSIGVETFANTTQLDNQQSSKRIDASIFSKVSYISALTPYPAVNRVLLDIFEGQLITCTVILAFILVFLIREWVVQQQPIVNRDQQQELIRLHREHMEHQQRQQQRLELLDQARRTLQELEGASVAMNELMEQSAAEAGDAEIRRPRMPNRDASSRATRVQQLIQEADAFLALDEDGELKASGAKDVQKPPRRPMQELPITNAGPDAKLNIQLVTDEKKIVAKPAKPAKRLISNEELEMRLNAIAHDDEDDSGEEEAPSRPGRTIGEVQNRPSPFQRLIDNAAREQAELDAAEAAAEEVEDDYDDDNLVAQAEDEHDDAIVRPEDLNLESDSERRPDDLVPKTTWDLVLDWFWGDITIETLAENAVTPDDAPQVGDNANEAPFAPVNHAHGHIHHDHDHDIPADPDVLAAAQQAGLDAEQIDDADDLEGIMELVGLRGPLAGLVQTSLFCLLLVVCTVAAAVVVPYIWGKLVLSFIGSPLYFMFKLPLQIISSLTDFIVDTTLFLGSWFVTFSAVAVKWAVTLVIRRWPRFDTAVELTAKISNFARSEAQASGGRLRNMFDGGGAVDPLGINAGFLGASIHSHAALHDLQAEANAVFAFVSRSIRWVITTLAAHDLDNLSSDVRAVLDAAISMPQATQSTLLPYLKATRKVLAGLKSGSITFQTSSAPASFDPALMYWTATDRTLAVCAGYAALAFIATVYVAADTPITRSAQKTEKMIRDSLRQAGGVFKVILIISIEMLVFPFYCGLLLDMAFLPLFADATLATRVALASTAPYVFCFVHWFVGTCYMFHFALFVGMCRKILRKGVLWFIRDPDDPTFHPVRDVLERNVITQLRKIAFSALVYGALVILCLGGVIWSIGKIFSGIFPIHWTATEPTVEFPMDLLLYNFLTPLVLHLLRPSDTIHAMYAWWLRKCARLLRLSHFLFDERRSDEEGRFKDKAMAGISRFMQPASSAQQSIDVPAAHKQIDDPGFEKSGQHVLTPCNDQYRPPKAGEAFMHIEKDNLYITDKQGKRNQTFAKVYIPPYFRSRVTLFMVCLWVFSVFCGLCTTLVPLVLGRFLLATLLSWTQPNDIYAYSLGAYCVGGSYMLARKSAELTQWLRSSWNDGNFQAWITKSGRALVRVAKLAYVYGLVFVVVPLVFSTMIEAHCMAPLHTWFRLRARQATPSTGAAPIPSTRLQDGRPTLSTTVVPPTLDHTVHVVQDLALGILLLRVVARSLFADGRSRASEVLRRATAKGRLDPDAYLTTRYLLLPVIALTLAVLGVPLLYARGFTAGTRYAGYELSQRELTLVYRFCFPAASASVLLVDILFELGKATSRWRARIRDEVYLVGEKLHNYQAKRPPIGAKSVMRREATHHA